MIVDSRVREERCSTLEEHLEHLERRAFAAYYRSGGGEQPTASLTGVFVAEYQAAPDLVGFRVYVRLANTGGTFAVYRYNDWGELRRLKRWPACIDNGSAKTYHEFRAWRNALFTDDVSENSPQEIDFQDLKATLTELSAAT